MGVPVMILPRVHDVRRSLLGGVWLFVWVDQDVEFAVLVEDRNA